MIETTTTAKGKRGQSVGQVGAQPVLEGVGQVVERTDTSYTKPADQTPLYPRRV